MFVNKVIQYMQLGSRRYSGWVCLVLLQCIKINKKAHSENSFPLVRSHKMKGRANRSRRELTWNVGSSHTPI
jgi:hypothetical protein